MEKTETMVEVPTSEGTMAAIQKEKEIPIVYLQSWLKLGMKLQKAKKAYRDAEEQFNGINRVVESLQK